MGILEMALLGAGLSMDAFAVSICEGLGMRRFRLARASLVGLFFGGAQGVMPALGWALGTGFADSIRQVDHWVAFALLAVLGGKMILDALREGEAAEAREGGMGLGQLCLVSVATSIDALAVGVTLAFLGADILLASLVIGVTTFAICFAGVAVGCRFGGRFEKRARLTGGAALILIGTKILLEHLGILP